MSGKIKFSSSEYCGECEKDFEPGEIVYFTWFENRSFCVECHVKLKPQIADWEPRKIPEGDEEL